MLCNSWVGLVRSHFLVLRPGNWQRFSKISLHFIYFSIFLYITLLRFSFLYIIEQLIFGKQCQAENYANTVQSRQFKIRCGTLWEIALTSWDEYILFNYFLQSL